jgi:methylisocitrate lyase
MNIEDQVFPKRCGHMAGKEVIPADEMAGKVRACADARDLLDPDFVLNARTDACAPLGLDEAIRRCNLYLRNGADLAFIDGIRTKADIARAVKEVNGPLSVNLMDAVSGVKTELVPIPELAKLGVGRVSIPVASIMVTHQALASFSRLKASPTGTWPADAVAHGFEEFTDVVGRDTGAGGSLPAEAAGGEKYRAPSRSRVNERYLDEHAGMTYVQKVLPGPWAGARWRWATCSSRR